MTTYFETKEQYLAFRKAWARAVNNDRRFSTLEPCDEWIKEAGHNGRRGFGAVSEGTGKVRVPGWITATHHVLYNILRNRPIETGFTPVSKTSRLQNGAYINHGLYFAVDTLINHITYAKQHKTLVKQAEEAKKKYPNSYAVSEGKIKRLEKFLEPFDGTVSIELLASIEVPKVDPLESNYAGGIKLAEAIMAANRKPITYQDMWDLYEEVK